MTKPILCGGSLISLNPPWVITAAHCLRNIVTEQDGYKKVSIGYGHSIASKQMISTIKRAIVHPLYFNGNQGKQYSLENTNDIPYDIGLIELSDILQTSEHINRIPLYTDTSTALLGDIETIGMGYIGYQQQPATILQRAPCNLTRINSAKYNNVILTTSDAGLCHGDSGSSLLYKPWDEDYVLKGVLNRILNAYDPNPNDTSCPVHESSESIFINSFVKPSEHLGWIMETTQLSLEQLIEPMHRPSPLTTTTFKSSASHYHNHIIIVIIVSFLSIILNPVSYST
ncbi:trypsin-like cysteine/serine peptidase domain-containing protein [Pilobolus umbonatus]|nr:trypsin-like cysteine/serine peptidase domain-containing protein [Pilobolus umbonatus]